MNVTSGSGTSVAQDKCDSCSSSSSASSISSSNATSTLLTEYSDCDLMDATEHSLDLSLFPEKLKQVEVAKDGKTDHSRNYTPEEAEKGVDEREKDENGKNLSFRLSVKRILPQASDDKVQTLEKLKCNICSKLFQEAHHLRHHIRLHRGLTAIDKGSNKGEKRSKSSLYYQRQKRNKPLKPFRCDFCGERFLALFLLKLHEFRHLSQKSGQNVNNAVNEVSVHVNNLLPQL